MISNGYLNKTSYQAKKIRKLSDHICFAPKLPSEKLRKKLKRIENSILKTENILLKMRNNNKTNYNNSTLYMPSECNLDNKNYFSGLVNFLPKQNKKNNFNSIRDKILSKENINKDKLNLPTINIYKNTCDETEPDKKEKKDKDLSMLMTNLRVLSREINFTNIGETENIDNNNEEINTSRIYDTFSKSSIKVAGNKIKFVKGILDYLYPKIMTNKLSVYAVESKNKLKIERKNFSFNNNKEIYKEKIKSSLEKCLNSKFDYNELKMRNLGNKDIGLKDFMKSKKIIINGNVMMKKLRLGDFKE